VEAKCKFWTHLLGKNPQSDAVVDRFGCAIEFLPILLVENAQMIRQTAASTDKVATQVQKSRAEFIGALTHDAQKRLLDADPQVKQIGRTGE
jgi:hypothetical protein